MYGDGGGAPPAARRRIRARAASERRSYRRQARGFADILYARARSTLPTWPPTVQIASNDSDRSSGP